VIEGLLHPDCVGITNDVKLVLWKGDKDCFVPQGGTRNDSACKIDCPCDPNERNKFYFKKPVITCKIDCPCNPNERKNFYFKKLVIARIPMKSGDEATHNNHLENILLYFLLLPFYF